MAIMTISPRNGIGVVGMSRPLVREPGLPLVAGTGRPRPHPIFTWRDPLSNLPQREPIVPGWRPRCLLSITGAADYLSVSHATIECRTFRGELPIVKIARSTRYAAEDLDLYIAINRCRNSAQTAWNRVFTCLYREERRGIVMEGEGVKTPRPERS